MGLNPVASHLQIHTYMIADGQSWHCWLCYLLPKMYMHSPKGDAIAIGMCHEIQCSHVYNSVLRLHDYIV